MAREHNLDTSIVLARSTASSVFRVGARGRAFTLSPPTRPPPPLIELVGYTTTRTASEFLNTNSALAWDV